MPHLTRNLTVVAFVLATTIVQADPKVEVQQLLSRPILAPEQTLADVQNFCAARVPPLPQPASSTEWEPAAKQIREQTLLNTVYRGEAAKWRDTPLKVEWFE